MGYIKELKYCSKCIMPLTTEGAATNETGECLTCQSQQQMENIDWVKREEMLKDIFAKAKEESGDNYDCIVPVSGGKDSAWQLWNIVKKYDLKPLTVTFNHNWFTKVGYYNLWNLLEKLNVDHVEFTPNRKLVNKMVKRSIEQIGDACYHCHAGVSAFVLQMAVAYKIPLIVWGESSAQYGHQGATYEHPVKFDRDYFLKLSSKLTPEEFSNETITMKDLFPFKLPSIEECETLKGIHLGDYLKWDTEKQVAFVKQELDWKERSVGGSYKDYKSIECSQAPIHDYMCYLKRGFGRSSICASFDVRAETLSKVEAFKLVKNFERIEPEHLEYLLREANMTKEEFVEAIEELKVKELKGVALEAKNEWRHIEQDGIPFKLRFLKEYEER